MVFHFRPGAAAGCSHGKSWSQFRPNRWMVKRIASLPVIQRDARSSWSSTQLWPTRGATNTARDNCVLDNAFVLIAAISLTSDLHHGRRRIVVSVIIGVGP